ncbi:MAG: hypothetical protein NT069_20350, partial [Planctomycetota bacterium]|nr:hypothetical protein [Planctomycetota bacterium]
MTGLDSSSDRSIEQPGNSDIVWREGDLIVIDRSRGDRLPPFCPLSGEPASRVVHCLFHKQRVLLAGGASPVEALLDGIRHYFQDVDKL